MIHVIFILIVITKTVLMLKSNNVQEFNAVVILVNTIMMEVFVEMKDR